MTPHTEGCSFRSHPFLHYFPLDLCVPSGAAGAVTRLPIAEAVGPAGDGRSVAADELERGQAQVVDDAGGCDSLVEGDHFLVEGAVVPVVPVSLVAGDIQLTRWKKVRGKVCIIIKIPS